GCGDDVGCVGVGVVVRLWWGGVVVVRRMEESEIAGWIDRLTRSIFGVHRKTPSEIFSGGGAAVVAGKVAEDGGGAVAGHGRREREI
ncbi:hypothetical protein Tco_0555247, partial [Tanacetum coccineum]